MTVRDREILDLLRAEPELLAVADAVAVTQPRPRRLPRPILAIPAIAVALIAVALLAPWQGSSPTFFERALAAVGDEPVLHAVVRSERPASWHLVDLTTGAVTAPPLRFETEIWYDRSRGLQHKITRVDGKVADDMLETPQGVTSQAGVVYTCAWIQRHPVEATRARVSCRFDGKNGTVPRNVPEPPPIVDPALGGFLSGYRDALTAGTVRKDGEGEIHGRPVDWLALTLTPPRPPGADRDLEPITERVAVDRETYKPILVRDQHGTSYEVSQIEAVPSDEANFSKPQPAPPETLVAGGSVLSREEITLDRARGLLGRSAVWVGQSFAGLELTEVSHEVQRTSYDRSTGLAPRDADGLVLEYGGGALRIIESAEPLTAYGWVTRGAFWPEPPDGFLRMEPLRAGYVRKNGLYVMISSPRGEYAIVKAARALEEMPAG